ncbi:Short-chain dehydrogenase [Alkalibacterium subtropicum]|uniref:Short-chain dehydrogenase n=1 Tax=Alkalibacterium subtropicum TaxID=753702 RepID=A0A1I1K965_9LACT|nr:SDR family oxidoreductase [Alkalibacterium subtropicum]SFC57075.1 Short-chain dehydrogenase [Alkalibacterium subtropicum]
MEAKHVVITGAGSGLGASLALKYSEMGYHITLLGRTYSKLRFVADKMKSDSVSAYTLDVSSAEEVTRVFSEIKEESGTIDILVNNAGVGVFDDAEKISSTSIDDMIDINLKGTIFCTQAVLPEMKERNEGTIIQVISTAGLEGKASESVYCASKFGARGFTESIVKELADTDIHVLAAYMGGMKTSFWDDIYSKEEIQHLMDPDDVADIILANVKARKNLTVPEIVIKNHLT